MGHKFRFGRNLLMGLLIALGLLGFCGAAPAQTKPGARRPAVVPPIIRRPPAPQPTGPAPVISGITPTDPDGAPYIYFGGSLRIRGSNFPTATDQVYVVVSRYVAPNVPSGAPAASLAEFHPVSSTATELRALAPVSLSTGPGRYSVWVRTTAGGWSDPVAVYFAAQPAPAKSALIEVGTFDALSGDFEGLVTHEVSYQPAPGKPERTRKVVPTVTVVEPWTKLVYHVRNADGASFTVAVSPTYGKENPAADTVVVNVGQATAVSWRVSSRGKTYRDHLNIKHTEPVAPPRERANAALDAFQASTRPGRFSRISKATLIAQIRARIANPTVMYQGEENLCGPVAALVALAQRNPERYVEMARSMYEDGQFAAASDYVIKPGSHLYSIDVPQSMAQRDAHVDWMLAASMRDYENAVLDMDPGDVVAAATTPGDVRKWFEKLLQCPRTSYDSCYVYGEAEALGKAATALANGASVALMVDAHFLPGQNPSWWDEATNLPNHWVLLQQVDSAKAPYRFTVFTWGRLQAMDGIDDGRLEDLLWGVVIGYTQ
jgi:hypothetical protein